MSKQKKIAMSATRMSMFLQCKWRYWCNYVLHMPKKDNPAFKLGISAHEALAVAGKIWKEKEKFTKSDINKIVDKYSQVASREGISDMNIYDEGYKMVLNKLNDFELGNIITIEDKFRVTTDEGVDVIGAMDKVIELNEDSVLVVDYKTSKYMYTPMELKADIQLSIYDLVASIKFPDYKRIILCLDYLRDAPVYTYRTVKERKLFAKYLVSVYDDMLKLTEKQAKPSLNDMCSWCDFNYNCPAYQGVIDGENMAGYELDTLDEETIIKKYINVKNKKKLLNNEEMRLKRYIMEKIKSAGENLQGDGKVLYLRQNSFIDYDPATLYESMPLDEFLKLVTVSKTKADNYMKSHPIDKNRVINASTKGYKSPFLAYKNI